MPINRQISDDYFKFIFDLITDSFEELMRTIQFNKFKLSSLFYDNLKEPCHLGPCICEENHVDPVYKLFL